MVEIGEEFIAERRTVRAGGEVALLWLCAEHGYWVPADRWKDHIELYHETQARLL